MWWMREGTAIPKGINRAQLAVATQGFRGVCRRRDGEPHPQRGVRRRGREPQTPAELATGITGSGPPPLQMHQVAPWPDELVKLVTALHYRVHLEWRVFLEWRMFLESDLNETSRYGIRGSHVV